MYALLFRQELSKIADGDHISTRSILDKITIEDYETIFTGKSSIDFNDVNSYKKIVGDFNNAVFNEEYTHPEIGINTPSVLSLSKEISITFIQALRDVVSEFQNNRTNPLLTLLKYKSGEIDPVTFTPIMEKVTDLNNSIEKLKDVVDVKNHISETINDVVGETYSPSSLNIKSDLPNEADKLFQSLKLYVGESGNDHEEAIHEISLGGANLIYLTLKLLGFKYQKSKELIASFLLIEEPEAHVHTHIQKTLFDKLTFKNTQIIYSTHSTHISEVSNINNINILSRDNSYCEAYQPYIGLTNQQSEGVQRYLDAVRSNLLFAKSVILIEGDAEEILIPIIIKKVFGISLDELGISLVNIRSTGFENIALLFHDKRIKKRCAIITDSDKSIMDNKIHTDDPADIKNLKEKYNRSEKSGISRRNKFDEIYNKNNWVNVFYAEHTFEVDFLTECNEHEIINTLDQIYSLQSTIDLSIKEINSTDVSIYGRRVLTLAERAGKGWFANLVGNNITYNTTIPKYILDAISFANSNFGPTIWVDIMLHRVSCINNDTPIDKDILHNINKLCFDFKNSNTDFKDITSYFKDTFVDDYITEIMDDF